ncbi:tRNA pseudouridine(55) synthase TruB [Clostridium rectalis]|uniref:tRNA pseudouridine(55) synthase TruB n=1 Tax=Clostridium rectalis TaxID=2040295 RepID=UPI000F642F12|nr:tRNA pseudouridine(55) synthase TruB [Clostridium rectalis]
MNGVLNILKPEGMTSFDVVRKVRKITNIKKVGHTGTLDPLASGVLPICIGNATKIVNYIMNDFKEYKAILKLGVVTDTYDREGKILSQKDINLSKQEIINTIESFKGKINQVPPMFSALKVNGKKLYELARQGIEIERKSREVQIYSIDIISIDTPFVEFKVKCSKGTYIRSLCYDIGNKLKVGGTMWGLERLQTGIFHIDDAININSLNHSNVKDSIIAIDKALYCYENVFIDNKYSKLLLNGVTLTNKYIIRDIKNDILLKVYLDNRFIGLGMKTEKGFKIVKLLV